VHGSYDDNVHPQHVQAFTDALIKAGKLFDLMIYPMRGHDIGDRDATLHLYRTMIDFWKRNLRTGREKDLRRRNKSGRVACPRSLQSTASGGKPPFLTCSILST